MARKPRKLVHDEVAQIRARFHEGITAGMGIAEATAYANQVKDEGQLDLLASKPQQAAALPKKAEPVSAPPIEPTWIDNGNQPSAFAEVEDANEAPVEPKPAPASPKPAVSAPAEKAPVAAKSKVEIPEKFEDLPWAKLRELCLKIGKQANSRIEAVAVIKAYVGK